jgi:hypothetical protein
MKPLVSNRVKRIHFVGTKARSALRRCVGDACCNSNEAHDEA